MEGPGSAPPDLSTEDFHKRIKDIYSRWKLSE